MRTEMHQAAFPGEDISDRAEPESVVPALLRLLDTRPASGRYRAQRPARRSEQTHDVPLPVREGGPPREGIAPAEAARFERTTRLGCRRATGGARCRPRRRQADGRHAAMASCTRGSPTSASTSRPGDLLVVNNSATLPAAVTGVRAKRGPIAVHFSAALDDHIWVVELRPATKATGHLPDVEPGERIGLPDGAALVVIASYPQTGCDGQSAVGRTVGDRRRRHVLPRQARAAHPIQLRPAALAVEQLSDGVRPASRQRRDGQCGKAVQRRAGDLAGRRRGS